MMMQPLATVFTLGGIGLTLLFIAKQKRNALRQSPYLIYFLISLLFALVTLPQEGSYINYLLEPLSAGARPTAPQFVRAQEATAARFGTAECVLLITDEFLYFPAKSYTYSYPVNQRAALYEEAFLRERLAKISDQPMRVLPFFPLKTAHAQAHEFCLNDSFLYFSMWHSGQLSADPFIASIESGYYDVVMWPLSINPNSPQQSVTPLQDIWAAIQRHYEPLSEEAGFLFLVKRPAAEQMP